VFSLVAALTLLRLIAARSEFARTWRNDVADWRGPVASKREGRLPIRPQIDNLPHKRMGALAAFFAECTLFASRVQIARAWYIS
jgi:hypothetical protein